MTTIVGITGTDGEVYIAGDARITDAGTGRFYDSLEFPKVRSRGGVAFGVAGDAQLVNHIVWGWEVPNDLPEDASLAVHAVLYPSIVEHVGDMDGEWQALVGYRGRIFYVDAKGVTHDSSRRFAAIGSGSAFALGFMSSAALASSEARLLGAIAVASEFDSFTSEKAYCVHT